LLLYSWGHFKDCSDRFLGHAQSVDNLLKVRMNAFFLFLPSFPLCNHHLI
uniref:Uncharacterized protein n=1 Tax=Aegilops tauschii subsp. strangulata TaxID=200361 RepID=A0A452ZMN0_AEGTS